MKKSKIVENAARKEQKNDGTTREKIDFGVVQRELAELVYGCVDFSSTSRSSYHRTVVRTIRTGGINQEIPIEVYFEKLIGIKCIGRTTHYFFNFLSLENAIFHRYY